MTVIAFDGKTLAADKRALNNGFASTVTKIGRTAPFGGDVVAWAVSGNLARGIAMKDWWLAGAKTDQFPAEGKDDWACFSLFGVSSGVPFVRLYESRKDFFDIETVPWAKGSGRDFALMAMRLGKTAEEAVRLTCELTVECGNGVDVIQVVP